VTQSAIPIERYSTKISAEFADEALARETVESLTEEGGFDREQVTMIFPDDRDFARKLEPESRGIGGIIASYHLAWGGVGLLIGLAAAWLLVRLGPLATQSNPVFTYLALIIICPMIGLLLAGALSIRPDHDRLVSRARAAAGSGRWTVVVHCADGDQKARAKRMMDYSATTL
jgi:hypothetical protein